MNLLAAKYLAADLMGQYLTNWNFKFNNARTTLGMCKYKNRTIELSRFYVVNNLDDSIRQTILHEIAHALAGSQAGHGWEWQRVARRIGVKNPSRCREVTTEHKEAIKQVANYVITCPTCGPLGYRHRMGKQMRVGTYTCKKCRTRGLQWETSR